MTDKNIIKHLTDDSFKKEISKGITLVDFHAEWCGPCRMLGPILDKIALDVKGKAFIAKVDIDSAQQTAAEFQITSVPTLILFKDGQEINRLVGLRNEEAVKKFVFSAIV
jgi:thioredoxin 1